MYTNSPGPSCIDHPPHELMVLVILMHIPWSVGGGGVQATNQGLSSPQRTLPCSAPLISSVLPSRTVMRGSVLSRLSVWLKHCMAVGSRMKLVMNCHRTKARAWQRGTEGHALVYGIVHRSKARAWRHKHRAGRERNN